MKISHRTGATALRTDRLALALALALSLGAVVVEAPLAAAAITPITAGLHAGEVWARARDRLDGLQRQRALASRSSPDRPAATVPVSNCNDLGAGSLRAALNASVNGDIIDLSELTCSTITLTSGALYFNKDISLTGPGAAALTISASYSSNVLSHFGSGTVLVAGLTIENGYHISADFPEGGCILSYGSVFLYETTVSHCHTVGTGSETTRGGAVFAVGDVTMIGSTVSHASAYAVGTAKSYGGGIYAGGNFSSKYSTISGNFATAANGGGFGGGLWILGSANIARSTISGNSAQTTGGAVLINRYRTPGIIVSESTISNNYASASNTGAGLFSKAPLSVLNSTITGNIERTSNGVKYGAGICLYGPVNADLQSTIIAGNFSRSGADLVDDDIAGDVTSTLSGSHNLLGVTFLTAPTDSLFGDPQLSPLSANGGPTQTHALLAGSPAIDAGSNPAADAFDQRGAGFARQRGSASDIGAVEFAPFVPIAPAVAKTFAPSSISLNAVSTLTITLSNANATPVTLTAGLYDILPASVLVAASPNASTDCGGGSVTADGDVVSLAPSAQIPAAGSCNVVVDVTSNSAGVFTNTIAAGDLQTDAGSNADPATADLTVSSVPIAPTLSKAFAPSDIAVDGISLLTIVLDNTNASDATLTASLTDALPPSLVVAGLGDATTSCTGGAVQAAEGTGTVVLDAGAQIPANGSCVVSVSVTAPSEGSFVNVIAAGALQTDAGDNPDPAQATLAVAVSTDAIFKDGFDGT